MGSVGSVVMVGPGSVVVLGSVVAVVVGSVVAVGCVVVAATATVCLLLFVVVIASLTTSIGGKPKWLLAMSRTPFSLLTSIVRFNWVN